MESHRLYARARDNPAQQDALLVVGNAVGARNNSIHRIVLFAGCASLRAPARPPSRPHARRGRGAVLNPGPAAMSTKAHTKAIAMLYRGVEYSVVQGIERHLWQWAATVSGTKISGARQRAGTRP
jgi:hypothetical protein